MGFRRPGKALVAGTDHLLFSRSRICSSVSSTSFTRYVTLTGQVLRSPELGSVFQPRLREPLPSHGFLLCLGRWGGKRCLWRIQNHSGGGASLTAQWLRLQASNAGGLGSIPGWGNKALHAAWHGQDSNNM